METSSTSATGESGFALIETIVSAVVLAVISLAVLSGIDGASNSAARERSRSVAAALGEQDQERMRAMSSDLLTDYAETRTLDVDGIDYTVTSRTEWIRDDTGGTVSCTNNSPQVDYLKVSSEVRSATVGRNIAPVTMTSLVAPPVGKAKGTLAVQVNNRDSVGLSGVTVSIVASGGGTEPAQQTNELGCAIFSRIPVDTYVITIPDAGFVDSFGNNPPTKGADVVNGTVQVVTMRIDQPGTAAWSVVSRNPLTGADIASTVATPVSASWAPLAGRVSAINGEEPNGFRSFTSSPATGLFPFLTPYGFFTGGCDQSNPANYIDADYYATYPTRSAVVPRGGPATPAVSIYQPPVAIRLQNQAGTNATTGAVRLTLVDPAVDTSPCTERYELVMLSDGTGWASKSSSTLDAGLPFGTYTVCGRTGSGSSRRWTLAAEVQIANNLLTGTTAGVTIKSANSRSTNPDAAACPA